MLSFKQINLHKATQATVMLGQGLEGQQNTVVLVTEPYTSYNKISGMPGKARVIFHRGPDQEGPPRAGIVATPDVKITAMDSWCRRDCAVALTKIGGVQTVLVSLYLDIKKEVQPNWLDNLMQMIDSKNLPLIMGIDSNAHSSLFGPDTNARGTALEDLSLIHI